MLIANKLQPRIQEEFIDMTGISR